MTTETEADWEELLAEGMANEEMEEAKVTGGDGHESVASGGSPDTEADDDGVDEMSDGSEGSGGIDQGEGDSEGVYTESDAEGAGVEEAEGMLETMSEGDYRESFMEINEDRLERVFGRDDRKRVFNTRPYPWRTLCKLEITAANGRRYGCSGALIGPRTVLTNGHCVYMHDNGGWVRRIRVIPGKNGGSNPYEYADSSFFHSVKGWTNHRSSNYDYAVIVLPSNKKLGNRVGWMGLANLSWAHLMGLRVNNSGYPGDKPYGTQWWNANNVLAVTSRRVYYRLDTFGGQSGSPVWRYRNGQRHIVAVHNTGGAVFNGSVRIVRPVFNNLVRWKNQYR